MTYTILQGTIWCFCHMAVLFWKICFPFSAKRFETANGFKYLHVATIIIALLLPTAPIIAHFATGGSTAFRQTEYPPVLCFSSNKNISFYGVALPISLLMQVGVTLLIYMFWKIYNVGS